MTDTSIVIASIAELTDFVRSTHVECTDSGAVHVVSVIDGSLASSIGQPSLRSPLAVSTVVAHFNCTYETQLSGSIEADSDQWLRLFRIAALSVSQCVRDARQGSLGEESIELLHVSGTLASPQMTGLELWVEHSCLVAAVQRVFLAQPSPAIAEVKKIALDVGYLLLTQRLDFGHPSLGFVAPLRRCDAVAVSLFAQLLESFMVTVPAHFPFMPARHFASIHWPIAVSESCSGKVHSLFRFPDQSMERDGAMRYCNYTTVKRRQPWLGRLSALQLVEVAINVLDTQRTAPYAHPFSFASKQRPSLWNESPTASLEECDAVLALLRGVVRRLRDVDPKLLYRMAPHAFHEAPACHLCSCSVGTIFERLNPLRSAGGAALTLRSHCRLCLHSVCTACIAPATTYVGDQVCRRCDSGLEALCLRDMTKTRRRLRFLAPRLTQATLAQHQKRLVGEEVLVGASDEAKDDDEDGADSPCCSETMSESLKDWRDRCSEGH